MPNEPLEFLPDVHRTIWGAETWLVSAHPTSPGIVASGAFAGRSLDALLPGFPLLVKHIVARTRLSVQVHLNERMAAALGGEPKTEMWCILKSRDPKNGPGAIYAGLKPGVGPDDVADAVRTGHLEELLIRHEVHSGDVFFIPGGLVHAIGDGVELFEVQQNSNTTYRLYDWGRVGADGKSRPLQVAASLRVIDFSLPPPTAVRGVDSPCFRFTVREVSAGETFVATSEFLILYFVVSGRTVLLPRGTRLTVPTAQRLFLVSPGSDGGGKDPGDK